MAMTKIGSPAGLTEPGPDDAVVIGIDPSSTKLAITVGTLDGSKIVVFTQKLRVARIVREKVQACGDAYLAGAELVQMFPKALLVALEAPVLGRGGAGSTIPQAYISGALQAALDNNGMGTKLNLANNQTWKRVVTGNAHAGKSEIAKTIRVDHRHLYELAIGSGKLDQDICDSIGIYLYAVGYVNTTRKLRRAFRKPPARRIIITEGTDAQISRTSQARTRRGRGKEADPKPEAVICARPGSAITDTDRAAIEDFGRFLSGKAAATGPEEAKSRGRRIIRRRVTPGK